MLTCQVVLLDQAQLGFIHITPLGDLLATNLEYILGFYDAVHMRQK